MDKSPECDSHFCQPSPEADAEGKSLSYADLLLLTVVFIWATNYTFGKIALREFEPTSIAALRTLFAAPILLVVVALKERCLHIGKKDILPFAILGLLGHFLNRFGWSYGLNFTTASNASLLMATTPIIAAVFATFLRVERITLIAAIGIAVTVLGVFFVIEKDFSSLEFGKATVFGDFFVLGGAFSFALFSVYAKYFLHEYSILRLTAFSAQFGAFFMVPFILGPLFRGALFHHSLKAWLCLLYISILGNALTALFWIIGISKIGPTRTTMYQTLVPLVAIAFAMVMLGERLFKVQVIGMVLVLGGSYLTRFR